MKLLYLSLALVSGQKALSEQVALAESKCTFFMEKAFDCDPPKSRDGHNLWNVFEDFIFETGYKKSRVPKFILVYGP